MPKSSATEETATFLTPDEWRRIQAELTEPYESFVTFLVQTGLRYSEVTVLEERDFEKFEVRTEQPHLGHLDFSSGERRHHPGHRSAAWIAPINMPLVAKWMFIPVG